MKKGEEEEENGVGKRSGKRRRRRRKTYHTAPNMSRSSQLLFKIPREVPSLSPPRVLKSIDAERPKIWETEVMCSKGSRTTFLSKNDTKLLFQRFSTSPQLSNILLKPTKTSVKSHWLRLLYSISKTYTFPILI